MNNFVSVQLTVISGQPDLVITTGPPTVTPSTVAQYGKVELVSIGPGGGWRLKNQGTGTVPAGIKSYVGYYLSTDATITASDTLLGSNFASWGLSPGESEVWEPPTLIIPYGTAPGDYYLGILVDHLNQVTESNEDNNFVIDPFSIAKLPNLTFTLPSGWSDKIVVSTGTGTSTDSIVIAPADTLYVDWAVINKGNAATGNSFQVTLKVDGVVKNTWTVSALDANASSLITDYSIGSLAVGSHTLLVTVDSGSAITENNETNNTCLLYTSPSPRD